MVKESHAYEPQDRNVLANLIGNLEDNFVTLVSKAITWEQTYKEPPAYSLRDSQYVHQVQGDIMMTIVAQLQIKKYSIGICKKT